MKSLFIVIVIVALLIPISKVIQNNFNQPLQPSVTPVRSGTATPRPSPPPLENGYEIVAEGLEIPWEIVFLPTGEILVTERPGRLLKVGADHTVIEIEGVRHIGEGGLMGLAMHPDFEENRFLYIYLTTEENGRISNRVERYRYENDSLHDRAVIIDGIEGSSIHDGGRISFGPDGYIYIATGDAGQPELAQDLNSLNGKILRLFDDGTIPDDNPFSTAMYSYGHRNIQGFAWDENERMWATEHGRSGARSGFDELNLIEPDKNYGWPDIEGDEQQEGMELPVVHSGPTETWAPAGMAYLNGSLYFAGLRGTALYKVTIKNGTVSEPQKFFDNQFGRIRAVVVGPDGYLYVSTSNRDGRGQTHQGDDKVIRIDPSVLK